MPCSRCATPAGRSRSSTICRTAPERWCPTTCRSSKATSPTARWSTASSHEQQIGAILHFAGSIVVPESVEKPLEYYANNTLASHALDLGRGRRRRAPLRLLVDRRGLWRAGAGAGRRERPKAADQSLRRVQADDRADARRRVRRLRFNYAALRYFNVSGADPQGRAGQIGKGSTHLIKVAVEAAVGKRDHVAVYGTDYPTPDGSCIRDYIHVSDLADAHVAALERLIERPSENLVHELRLRPRPVGARGARRARPGAGTPVPRMIGPRRAGDPPQLVASNRALVETLDWTPRFADIDTIVAHALAWERSLQGGIRLMIKRAIFALGALLSLSAATQSAPPPTPADPAAAARIRAHVEFLADDLLEGRDTGSRGYEIAADLCRQPVPRTRPPARRASGGWFQQVKFRTATLADPAPVVELIEAAARAGSRSAATSRSAKQPGKAAGHYRAAGVRRLRHQRAGAQDRRLCRPRRPREDRGRSVRDARRLADRSRGARPVDQGRDRGRDTARSA